MPISEDEYDFRQGHEAQSTMSKAELRKTHKPIMEKRRRARINQCLNEIKTLILEAMKKDPARHSKLEKADILEMAVKYLQNMQRQQLTVAMATDPSVMRRFKNGFNECAAEINKYVNQIEGVDNSLKQRINQHMSKCMKGVDQISSLNFPSFANLSLGILGNGTNSDDQNNNPRIQLPQGIQLIPSRLPTGEFALLLPNSSALPFLPQLSASLPPPEPRQSAFVSVVPTSSLKTQLPKSSPIPENVQLSPQGFKPVHSSHRSAFTATYKQESLPQVPQVTSTSLEKTQQIEVKTMKYPIHNYGERDKKIIEPLCVITNQSERFKQAQTKEDGISFEENIPYGNKRKYPEGLLAVAHAQEPPCMSAPKRQKLFHNPSTSVSTASPIHNSGKSQIFIVNPVPIEIEDNRVVEGVASTSGGSSSQQSLDEKDMWRPW